MTEIQIAWLELMTVGGLGVILVLLGVTFNIIVKRQNKLCTKKTDGIVKQYGFPGNGRVYPIVEYFVNGITVFLEKQEKIWYTFIRKKVWRQRDETIFYGCSIE